MKNVKTASSPNNFVSDPETIPCHSEANQVAENAPPALGDAG